MNFSGINFGMQPFATPYPNLQTQLPQQINTPCQQINQPVNIASSLQMPIIPTVGRYYVPSCPQTYTNNIPTLQMPQSFGQGQIQKPMQTPQEMPAQIQQTSQQQLGQMTPNVQTANNQTFGQTQAQPQTQTQQFRQMTPNVQTANNQTFGQTQAQTQTQTQQFRQMAPNVQTTNNQTFGQTQAQPLSMSCESLNAINNYPNSNPQIQNMQPNQIQQ